MCIRGPGFKVSLGLVPLSAHAPGPPTWANWCEFWVPDLSLQQGPLEIFEEVGRRCGRSTLRLLGSHLLAPQKHALESGRLVGARSEVTGSEASPPRGWGEELPLGVLVGLLHVFWGSKRRGPSPFGPRAGGYTPQALIAKLPTMALSWLLACLWGLGSRAGSVLCS